MTQTQSALAAHKCKCGADIQPRYIGPHAVYGVCCLECSIAHDKAYAIGRAGEQALEVRTGRRGRAAALRVRLRHAVPPLYAQAHLRHLSEPLRRLLTTLPAGRGVYLWGPARVGKTYAAMAYARAAVCAGHTVQSTTWTALTLRIRASYRAATGEQEAEILDSLCTTDRLIIDDIGVSFGRESDFCLRVLLHVLDTRLAHLRPTLITANRPVDDLVEIFDPRIVGRIKEMCIVQSLKGTAHA